MKRTRATAVIVVLAALALLAAACGSSSPPPSAAPAPTATATAEAPVDTPTPTATPTTGATSTAATVPDTDGTTEAYDVDRMADRALDFLTAFTNDLSPRASGTDQEKAAADFLAKLFEDLGYSTSVQEFSFEVDGASATLSPGGGEPTEVPALRMYLSGLGEATGDLVHVDLALAEDIPDQGLEGKIALVRRAKSASRRRYDALRRRAPPARSCTTTSPACSADGWKRSRASPSHYDIQGDRRGHPGTGRGRGTSRPPSA